MFLIRAILGILCLIPNDGKVTSKCDPRFGICFSETGRVVELGPPGILIARYQLPPKQEAPVIPKPRLCDPPNSDGLSDWCSNLMRTLQPVSSKANELLQVLETLKEQMRGVALPRPPKSSGSVKPALLWSMIRAIIPDSRVDAIESSVQGLLNHQKNMAKSIEDLAGKLVSGMDVVDQRLSATTAFFTNTTSAITRSVLALTKQVESGHKNLSYRVDVTDMKISSLAQLSYIATHSTTSLIDLILSISELHTGILAASTRTLSPSLVPPSQLIMLLNQLTATLLPTEYELLHAPTQTAQYYGPQTPVSLHMGESETEFVVVFTVPTVSKRNWNTLLAITGFEFSLPVQLVDDNGSTVSKPGVMRAHPGVQTIVLTKPSKSDSLMQAIRIAEINTNNHLATITTLSYTVRDVIWMSPNAVSNVGCLTYLFSRLLRQDTSDLIHNGRLPSMCTPTLRRVPNVQLTRIAHGLWNIVVDLPTDFELTVQCNLNPDGSPASSPINIPISDNYKSVCKFGCLIELPCGASLKVEAGLKFWTTSPETHDCTQLAVLPKELKVGTSTYFRQFTEIIMPNFTVDQNPMTDTLALSRIRDSLEVTRGQIEQFKKTDDEIVLRMRGIIGEVKTIHENVITLSDRVHKINERMLTRLSGMSRFNLVYRVISGIFLAITIALTIFILVKLCLVRTAGGIVISQLLPKTKAQFSLSFSNPVEVTSTDSVWWNPDLWGLLIGIGLLIGLGVLAGLCWKRVNKIVRPRGYHNPTQLVFEHLGDLIDSQMPKLTGSQVPVVRDIPKIMNLAMSYPSYGDIRCLLQVWVNYAIPKVGIMSFLTAVGSVKCEDRGSILSASVEDSVVELQSPGTSTVMSGKISGVSLQCRQGQLNIDDCPVRLSVPPSITSATFTVRGLCLTCERCGSLWLSLQDRAIPESQPPETIYPTMIHPHKC